MVKGKSRMSKEIQNYAESIKDLQEYTDAIVMQKASEGRLPKLTEGQIIMLKQETIKMNKE